MNTDEQGLIIVFVEAFTASWIEINHSPQKGGGRDLSRLSQPRGLKCYAVNNAVWYTGRGFHSLVVEIGLFVMRSYAPTVEAFTASLYVCFAGDFLIEESDEW